MKNSIKKSKDFKIVYETKKSFATKNLVVFILKRNDMESNRCGISVSHKVGNSFIRHTLIRRIREIFRKNEKKLMCFYDIVIVLRVGSDKKEFSELEKDFLSLCEKHGIIKKED